MTKPLAFFLPFLLLAAQAAAAADSTDQHLAVEKIQRGMTGTCHTVFQGTQVEPFGFEVLGVMHNMLGPQQDVVLTRLTGEKAEFTGVVSGMSGSPCYIDGQLIGALAYRFGAFTKQPIAGITPIKNMLDIIKLPADPLGKAGTAPTLEGMMAQAAQRANPASGTLRPIGTPLAFGGFHPAVVERFTPVLQGLGFTPALAGTASGGNSAGANGQAFPKQLEPGGAIAGQLVRGDMTIDGTGTVSYVKGNRVLAFGHPFFGQGYVQIPMATSYIIHILSSESGSYKMAESGTVVGAITQDRLTAIYGELGKQAPLIPMQIEIQDASTTDPTRLNLEVFQNPTYTPVMVVMSAMSALQSRLNYNLGGSLQLSGEIKVDGQTLRMDNFYSAVAGGDVTYAAAVDVASRLFQLWNNPFQTPNIEHIRLKFSLIPETRLATIESVWTDTPEVRPGEKVNVRVRMRPWRAAPVERQFLVEIPENTPVGPLMLVAGDASTVTGLENSVKTGYGSYHAMLEDLQVRRRSDQLHVLLVTDEQGLARHSQILPKLPPTVLEQLEVAQRAPNMVPLARSPWKEYTLPAGQAVAGQGFLMLKVLPDGRHLTSDEE